MKKVIRLLFLFSSIFLWIFLLSLVRFFLMFFPAKRALLASYLVHLLNRILSYVLGIRVRVFGQKGFLKKRGIFFVSNHLSYLDGIAISRLSPLLFIGGLDLKRWPLFGVLVWLGETIFVNRINPSNIHNELKRMIFLLRKKINILLFPEGTSTDGSKILSFKTPFFEAPLRAGCKIVPLVIRYTRINSQPLNEFNRDLVYWYGEMRFMPHLLSLLGLRSIEIEIQVGNPFEVVASSANSSFQRKELSRRCREAINNQLESFTFGAKI